MTEVDGMVVSVRDRIRERRNTKRGCEREEERNVGCLQ